MEVRLRIHDKELIKCFCRMVLRRHTLATERSSSCEFEARTWRLKTWPNFAATEFAACASVGGGSCGDSSSSEVTPRSAMPQGTIQSKSRRSVVTLSAKPCEVMACETW